VGYLSTGGRIIPRRERLDGLCQGLNNFPFLHPGCFRRGSGIGVADPKLHLTQIQTAPLLMSSIS
jgi:hypothetical protein